jgi:vitamin B12 transporter
MTCSEGFMRQLLSTVSILAIGCWAAAAQAQSDEDEVFDLGQVFILGGLTPVEADNLGRAVSVVEADEIEARGLTSVQEAIRALPGISVSSSGSNLTQVRMRGGEASHVLILIDGVEAAGGDSEYYLSGLETANIERIEVLRGPQSVVYGSNASSGVINIVTRRADRPGLSWDTRVEGGAGRVASGFVGWRGVQGGISLSLSHNHDLGYDISGDGGERDETLRRSAILSGDYQISDVLGVDFTLRRSRERYDYDATNWVPTGVDDYIIDDPTLFANTDETTAALNFTLETMDGRLMHRLGFETTRDDRSANGGAPTETQTDAIRYRLSFGLDGQPADTADHLLNAMLEWERDQSSTNVLFDRRTTSYALEYRGTMGPLSLQGGVRYDDNRMFEDALTWTLAGSYDFDNSGMRLHASAGTGVVNPSYLELYGNPAWGITGNPTLSPERNRSFDIGLEVPVFGNRGTVDVTLFHEVMTDEITYVPTGPGTGTYINQIGESPRRGVELAGRVQVSDVLSLRMAYTYLRATNPNGTVEIRRPQHELSLGTTWGFAQGRGSLSADLRHVRGNWDTQFWGGFATVELPSYTTVDVSARYELNDRVSIIGRVHNLFDADVMDVWGYAGRGRSIYVGLQARG